MPAHTAVMAGGVPPTPAERADYLAEASQHAREAGWVMLDAGRAAAAVHRTRGDHPEPGAEGDLMADPVVPGRFAAIGHYWLDDPDAPFATLLCVAGTYCHPEADPDAYGDLIRLARTRPDDAEMRRVKTELGRVLIGDTRGLHPDALFTAACYPDGSDTAFAARLWRHLFGDEPLPAPRGVGR